MNRALLLSLLALGFLFVLPACLVENADNDRDGIPATADCDDEDADSTAVADDGDCDGVLTADDCNDGDSSSTVVADDGDCDGVSAADDCDDDDPTSLAWAMDGDCDGALTAEDCDDDDWTLGAIAADGDCDGALTADDCDDSDSTVFPGAADTWYDGVDSDCAGNSDYDADGDGHDSDSHKGLDCDDTDSLVNPEAAEVCDEADNDCDGSVDEDVLITFWTDSDGDGYGDLAAPVTACVQPPGASTTSDDCDDSDATTHPDAEELCDGQVNACGTQLAAFETDDDSDGYVECQFLNPWVGADPTIVADGDCDDSDAAINPDASEVCFDGVDNDCDGDRDCEDFPCMVDPICSQGGGGQ